MMFYKRLREIDVPEMMASIITETTGKPWGYYRDMTRQLWDEARHAMMGEVGFVGLGVDWTTARMINFTWSLRAQHATAQPIGTARRALLHRAGADAEDRQALRVGGRRRVRPSARRTFQDYDWADEVLHARIGRDWYVTAMPSHAKRCDTAISAGPRCWPIGTPGGATV